nr:TetR/AcrR family transcriptional regulator C-terminal domain-containing protein [Microbacterium bovistercoris]
MSTPDAAPLVALLWGSDPRPRRGPKPRLSVPTIADAAIAIADEGGLDAVTMQVVADRLDAAKMALYRYVPGRTELDAIMLDRALDGAPDPIEGPSWRARLAAWGTQLHDRMAPHPWAVELAQRPHPPGPSELAWYEAGLAAMTKLPLAGAEKLDVLVLLVGHVLGLVRQERARPAPEQELADTIGSIPDDRAAAYPLTLAAFADAGARRDDALRFGIDRILDGVAALTAGR